MLYIQQDSINRCVCIVYDPFMAPQGQLGLKALRLKDKFMEAYRKEDLTYESLRRDSIGWSDIFEEIPLHVHNSSLVTALVGEIDTG